MLFSTKRSSRFRSSTTQHNPTQENINSLCRIHHNPRRIFTNHTDPLPIRTPNSSSTRFYPSSPIAFSTHR
ncbi:hypothetical protein VNO77_17370 [Canavalia gladiata]|uniref:Uncharacterized protein n=1 Tax=Canavalia gladiata TaxID=3824 RepID=A0AAN9LIU6_CANGL